VNGERCDLVCLDLPRAQALRGRLLPASLAERSQWHWILCAKRLDEEAHREVQQGHWQYRAENVIHDVQPVSPAEWVEITASSARQYL
jgi:hypothetical protein